MLHRTATVADSWKGKWGLSLLTSSPVFALKIRLSKALHCWSAIQLQVCAGNPLTKCMLFGCKGELERIKPFESYSSQMPGKIPVAQRELQARFLAEES